VRERLATRELDVIRVQGKGQPTRIFEVLGISPLAPDRVAMVRSFETGLRAYRAQQWEDAIQRFQHVFEVVPGDRALQDIYGGTATCGLGWGLHDAHEVAPDAHGSIAVRRTMYPGRTPPIGNRNDLAFRTGDGAETTPRHG
jgi:hypothetical protein